MTQTYLFVKRSTVCALKRRCFSKHLNILTLARVVVAFVVQAFYLLPAFLCEWRNLSLIHLHLILRSYTYWQNISLHKSWQVLLKYFGLVSLYTNSSSKLRRKSDYDYVAVTGKLLQSSEDIFCYYYATEIRNMIRRKKHWSISRDVSLKCAESV